MTDSFIDRFGFDDVDPQSQEELLKYRSTRGRFDYYLSEFENSSSTTTDEVKFRKWLSEKWKTSNEIRRTLISNELSRAKSDNLSYFSGYRPAEPGKYDFDFENFKKIIKYPYNAQPYQTLFIKMETFVSRKSGREPDNIMFLPLPSGLFRSESGLVYNFDEQNILGELGKSFGNAFADFLPKGDFQGGLKSLGQNKFFDNTFIKFFNTFAEQNIQEGQNEIFQQLRMGAGYELRKNFTKVFLGIDKLRNFRVQWKLYPKSAFEAQIIEQIARELQKASLPETSDVSFFDELGSNTIIPRRPDYVLGGHNDTQTTVESRADVEAKEEFIHKFYSSTYRVPKEIELSVVEILYEEKNGKIEHVMNPIDDIINLPSPFVIDDITIQIGGEESEADTFLKETDRFGFDQYYNASYLILIGLRETVFFTADDVQGPETYNYVRKS